MVLGCSFVMKPYLRPQRRANAKVHLIEHVLFNLQISSEAHKKAKAEVHLIERFLFTPTDLIFQLC